MAQNGAGPQEAAQVVTQRALQLLVPDKTPGPWVLGPGYHPKSTLWAVCMALLFPPAKAMESVPLHCRLGAKTNLTCIVMKPFGQQLGRIWELQANKPSLAFTASNHA